MRSGKLHWGNPIQCTGKWINEHLFRQHFPLPSPKAYFNIPRNELAQSSVQVHLFALHGTLPLLKRKHRIGSLTLSQQSQCCSSPDAQTHWQEMIQGMGITVDKWHMLE